MKPETFFISTYGCKVNQYESQLIREGMIAAGLREANHTHADIVVVNTCTVTAQSDSKIRQAVRRIARTNPDAVIMITGCGAKRHEPVFEGCSNIHSATGANWRERQKALQSEIAAILHKRPPANDIDDPVQIPAAISSFGGHTRAFVKAQDGCNSFCTYCTVPLVRGPSFSRDLAEVYSEVRRLAERGYKEVVLTGIHLGQYRDSDNHTLPDLLQALIDLPHEYRLRLSSIEPQDINERFIEVFARSSRIMPHLHLPLQHGDNDILFAMNRQYTIEQYSLLVEQLRAAKDDVLITTDLIVGFPGETQDQFERSLAQVMSIGFLKVHVFPFSSRPDTKADSLPGKLAKSIIKPRVTRAIEQTGEQAQEIKSRFIDRTFDVLVESRKDRVSGRWVGFTPNYIKVMFSADVNCANTIMPVRLTGCTNDSMTGVIDHANSR